MSTVESPHESVTGVAKDLWKNNRPLAVTLLVALIAIGYIVYKRSGSSLIAPNVATDITANGMPGNVINNSYTTITKTVTGQPVPTGTVITAPTVPPVTSAFGNVAMIRGKQTSGVDKAWDSSHAGVPVRAQASGSAAIVKILPFGGSVQLLHSALTAAPNQRGGSSQWYPVAGGYLSAWDIASIK